MVRGKVFALLVSHCHRGTGIKAVLKRRGAQEFRRIHAIIPRLIRLEASALLSGVFDREIL